MAFENLTSRLNMALRRFVHKDYLNEKDIDEMMKEVRLSLLEADVNIKVVNSFINDVKQKALGEKIMKGLNPGQQVVKVVSDELTKVLGSAFLLASVICLLYFQSKNTNFLGSPAI